MKDDTVETRVERFLFTYKITPHATTGLSPAQMLMSRKLRSTFDLLLPDQNCEKNIRDKKKAMTKVANSEVLKLEIQCT